MISVVIPTFNALEFTKLTLDSLDENTSDYELVIVDDGSTDGTREFLKSLKCKVILNKKNLGISATWNIGVKACTQPFVCIANSDILFTKNWDTPLIKALVSGYNVASPFFTDYEVPGDFPLGIHRRSNRMPVLGCCFMVKRTLFDEIGYFPEEMKLWYGDNWLGDKAVKTIHCANSYIHHFVSKSANSQTVANFKEQIGNDEKTYLAGGGIIKPRT